MMMKRVLELMQERKIQTKASIMRLPRNKVAENTPNSHLPNNNRNMVTTAPSDSSSSSSVSDKDGEIPFRSQDPFLVLSYTDKSIHKVRAESTKSKMSDVGWYKKRHIYRDDLLHPVSLLPFVRLNNQDSYPTLLDGMYTTSTDSSVKYSYMNVVIKRAVASRRIHCGTFKDYKIPIIIYCNSDIIRRKWAVCIRFYSDYVKLNQLCANYFKLRGGNDRSKHGQISKVSGMNFWNNRSEHKQSEAIWELMKNLCRQPHILSHSIFHLFFFTDMSTDRIFDDNFNSDNIRIPNEDQVLPHERAFIPHPLKDKDLLVIDADLNNNRIHIGHDVLEEINNPDFWKPDPQAQQEQISPELNVEMSQEPIRNPSLYSCIGNKAKCNGKFSENLPIPVLKLNHEQWIYRSFLELGCEERVRQSSEDDNNIEVIGVPFQKPGLCPDATFCQVEREKRENKKSRLQKGLRRSSTGGRLTGIDLSSQSEEKNSKEFDTKTHMAASSVPIRFRMGSNSPSGRISSQNSNYQLLPIEEVDMF